MRFALVTEVEVESGKRRCGIRRPGGARADATEPADAAKAPLVFVRAVDAEPSNAAKGERGLASSGAITC